MPISACTDPIFAFQPARVFSTVKLNLMTGKNSVQLVGYVGQDIKETKSKDGHRVAIRMATHFYMTRAPGDNLVQTTWHNIVAWDEQAEFALRNFMKGSKILVEGRIVYGNFVGRDGQVRNVAQIRAHSLLNLDR
jgi:single-strand DNA-binding protein